MPGRPLAKLSTCSDPDRHPEEGHKPHPAINQNQSRSLSFAAGPSSKQRPRQVSGLSIVAGGRPGFELARETGTGNPNSSAWGFRASITNRMCSSKSTPSSSTLLLMISRSTLAANALSLSFFLTLFGSSVAIPSGRTRQQAMTKPGQFVAGQQALVHHGLRRQAPLGLMERDGVGHLFLALLPQPIHDPLGMLFGPLVVVGVVQQAGDGPDLRIGSPPYFDGRRPHHDLDGSGVLQQGIGLGPGVESEFCLVVRHGYRLGNDFARARSPAPPPKPHWPPPYCRRIPSAGPAPP